MSQWSSTNNCARILPLFHTFMIRKKSKGHDFAHENPKMNPFLKTEGFAFFFSTTTRLCRWSCGTFVLPSRCTKTKWKNVGPCGFFSPKKPGRTRCSYVFIKIKECGNYPAWFFRNKFVRKSGDFWLVKVHWEGPLRILLSLAGRVLHWRR